MIDCPICHVKNEDDARFCAECGQRLNGPAPAQAPAAQPAPPPPSNPAPQQRLHSPLLSGDAPEGPPADPAGDVNRLRQMSSRPAPTPPAQPPQTAYANPFDPRNAAPAPGPAPAPQPAASEPPKQKLRSPLLAGEEFDDEEEPPYQPTPQARGGLHSPLLGGGHGSGSHLHSPLLEGSGHGSGSHLHSPLLEGGDHRGSHLRSPLLGGGHGDNHEDQLQSPAQGGAHLRSPLLGGGGDYAGTDRRKNAPSTPFHGQERRKSGLRSPILGGEEEYYDDYDEDEEPIDEDNPNVLRSPLLAAKRPVLDRPQKVRTPANSNAANAMRGPQPAEMPVVSTTDGSPTSSYTSLQSISSATGPHAIPSSIPQAPGPGAAPVQPALPGACPGQPQAQPVTPQQVAPQAAAGPLPGAPISVPAAFQGMQPAMPGTTGPGGAPQIPTPTAAPQSAPPGSFAQDVRQSAAAPGTGSGITVQPPRTTTSGSVEALDQHPRHRGSRLLGSADDEEEFTPQSGAGRFQAAQPASGSPIPKMIGALAVLLLLVKLFVFMQMMGTPWKDTLFLVLDQVVGLVVIICLIVMGFTSK